MSESQYLEFRFVEQKPKTKVWEVASKVSGVRLGLVKYFGRWRQYAFFPEQTTVWNSQCLSDVVTFLEEQNELRKGEKKGVISKPHCTIEDWLLMGGVKKAPTEKLSDDKLLEHIKNKTYRCCFCSDLKKLVLEKGVEEIDKYDGMICGGVEEMFELRGRY